MTRPVTISPPTTVRRFRAAFIATALLAVAAPALAQRFGNKSLVEAQKEQARQMEQNFKGLPVAEGHYKAADLCRVQLKGGKWEISTLVKLPKSNGQTCRVIVDDLPGIVTMSRAAGVRNPMQLEISHTDCTDPRAVQISTSLSLYPDRLSISRSVQLIDGWENISLSQSLGISDYGALAGTTQLAVNSSDNRGRSRLNFNRTAPDLPQLRRQSSTELDKYIRPILRTYRLESIFAADTLIAWQVFADDWKADAELAAKVTALVAQLDADAPQQRSDAVRQLQAIGQRAALCVSHLDRKKFSDQQNILIDKVITPFFPKSNDQARAMKEDPQFLLDCLYSEDRELRVLGFERLKASVDPKLVFEPEAEFTKRLDQIETIRTHVLKASAATTLPAAG